MGYVLTIYSRHAYKEYLLPAETNINYKIVLFKELFQLSEDIVLEMENTDGGWKFLRGKAYSLTRTDNHQDVIGELLQNNDIYSLVSHSGEKVTVIVKVTTQFFRVFQKFDLDSRKFISIGTAPENTICYDFMRIVSKEHAVIRRDGGGYLLEDRSTNGIFVNAKRITGTRPLEYGDRINVFGLTIIYLGKIIAVDTSLEHLYTQSTLKPYIRDEQQPGTVKPGEDAHVFHRAPRYLPKLAADAIKIEAPPEPKERDRQPLLLTIGPSLTMAFPMILGSGLMIWGSSSYGGSGVFMYAGLITAVSSALLGTTWSLVNLRSAKKQLREGELKRFEVYGEYLISCANEVQEKYKRNTQILQEIYISPEVCCRYDHTSMQLWNRNRTHTDFLRHRLGIGELPFQVTIEIPQERFTMVNDSLATKAKMIRENYAMLRDVPVCVDLGRKLVGLIGGSGRAGCYPIVYSLAAQLAASSCYTDVKMAFIYDGRKNEIAGRWEFAKWLPHIWSEDRRIRYVADNPTDASDVFYELAKVLRMRAEARSSAGGHETQYKPHYVLFIEDVSVLEGELITSFLMDQRSLGVSVVLLAESYEDLPNACEYIIENTKEFQGIYEVTDPVEDRNEVAFDQISERALEEFARRLSCIQVNEIETGGELPSTLTFFEMYGVHGLRELNVLERWQKNRTYDNIKGLLGQKSGGANCYLDVHEKYHGPHGLIAGTTGSGKSETLQTYMLSLAVNYSPDDIGFFVIDYKGGGMANLFSDLPHLIGQISNLSGNQIHRAMVSIKSENVRRQRVFNEHDVNNINSYTRLYKNGEAAVPIPHMFIIIDEFAELKREEPDFMKELISVAQVGRSLGVHLILATQKPSGTVDDNIWSNAKFRLCLRVQDGQDSKDMLHRPDAAYITQAGRCYLQVGNDEIFELFQSGWSGAAYEPDEENTQEDIARMLSVTGRAALVGSHTKIKKHEQEKLQWIASLLDAIAAAGGTPDEVGQCMHDSVRMARLIERFFEASSETLEYPQSDYNGQRVKDLVITYGMALESAPEEDADLPALVLQTAAVQGKKLPELKKKTQLEAVVEYLRQLAEQNHYVHNLQLWLPVLPETLYLEDLSGYTQNVFDGTAWPLTGRHWTLEAFVGLCDDPVNQAQMPLMLDFADSGHCAVCGTVVSGKSTFLVTYLYSMVMRYPPNMVNIYALDFSSKMLSAFEGLAHVGGVLYEEDEEKIAKLFHMLGGMLEERKQIFRGGNYRQFIQAEAAKTGNVANASLPAVILVIDNYSAFRAKTDCAYDDFILKLAKEGVSCGIFLLATAGGFSTNEIPLRLSENFRTVLCLEMTDKYAYGDALRTLHFDVLPEENVKGRGLTKVGDSILEFQTALPLAAADDFARSDEIRRRCEALNAFWDGKWARKIPEIPQKPVWQEFAQMDDVLAMQREGDCIPIGYDQKDASIYGIDLRRTYTYLVSGRSRTGKTNLLRVLAMAGAGMDAEIVLIDYAKEFTVLAGEVPVRHITSDQELFTYLLELQPEFKKRNQFKKECVESGDTDEDLYVHMKQNRKIFILIGNLTDFAEHVSHPDEGVDALAPFLTVLLERGAGHNVYWFAGFNPDDSAKAAGLGMYLSFTKYKTGIHFGGNVSAQRVLDFEYLPFNERSTVLKPGIGLLPMQEGDSTAKVVIPLYRRA